MYLALISNGMVIQNNMIWRLMFPLKIKIFMWYMYKEVVLTKDNLARRNWNGGKQCCFCHKMKLSNICFSNVGTPNLFGVYHKLLSILYHCIVLITCSMGG
jgi:hypothetical protein